MKTQITNESSEHPMKKNTLFTVVKIQNQSYCLTLAPSIISPKLYYTTTPYRGEKTFLGAFHGHQMWLKSPNRARRIYFVVISDNHPPLWAASTQVEIDSLQNFRDMGGYLTQEGKTVKWGAFYRSGALLPLTGDESDLYEAINIKHVLDYRSLAEAGALPDHLPKSATYYPVPAMAEKGNIAQLASTSLADMMGAIQEQSHADEAMALFSSLYQQLPFGNPAYKALFAAMDDQSESNALLQHCSAGKDRTGVGSALVLLALGVDEQSVMEDYLLSNIFRDLTNEAKSIEKMSDVPLSTHALQVATYLSGVAESLLNTSLNAIKSKYNSYEEFFMKEYQVDEGRLKAWKQRYTV